jgi:hypothetical protein
MFGTSERQFGIRESELGNFQETEEGLQLSSPVVT